MRERRQNGSQLMNSSLRKKHISKRGEKMGLIAKGTMVIIGLVMILIVGQIVVDVFPQLDRIFSENTIFNVGAGATFVLLSLLGVGLVIRIILNLFEEDKKPTSLFQPPRPQPRRFNDQGEERFE